MENNAEEISADQSSIGPDSILLVLQVVLLNEGSADFLESFQEAYQGQFDSDEDFAQSIAEDLGAIDKNASWPNNCIDWEMAAKEIMYDYSEEGGYYFRNL